MYHSQGKYFIITIILLFLVSCKHSGDKTTLAFYYWKSNFNIDKTDISYLKDAGVQKLYLHFFDVSWNETYNRALPVAEMKFEAEPTDKFQYVPVVYITTKSLNNTDGDSINKLAEHIYDEVEHITTTNKITYKELQFDCDWTDATHSKYFALLSFFRNKFKSTGQLVSATIRLHQIKYADKTGVPPIDRGMLMFYNMGTINSIPGYNSIYNDKDADKYVSYISAYTLPLDVALPVYSWAIWERNGRVQDIIEKALNKDFADTAMFRSAGNNIFVSRGPLFFRGKYFMKNDTVKTEEVTPDICEDAATNVAQYLKNEPRTVSLFEYDTLYLSTYNKKDLEKIYTLSR
jgi:hypothetical protein